MRDDLKSRWSGALRRVLVGPLAVVGCGWFAGCYQFVQVDSATAPVGARVRAELTSQGSDRFAEATNGEAQGRIEGKVIEASPDGGMILEVSGELGGTPAGVGSRPLFARVALPAGDLIGLELRQLSGRRTALLIGAGIAAATVIVAAAFDIGAGGNGEGGGGGVDEARIPFFSFHIRR